MALTVYFTTEIARVLASLAVATSGVVPEVVLDVDDPATRRMLADAYRQGAQNALVSVGLAFGLEPIGLPAQDVQQVEHRPPQLWAEIPRDG